MSLTPRAVRTDLKCGKGAIPEGKKCHKGAATKVQTHPTASAAKYGAVEKMRSGQAKPTLRMRTENAAIKHGGTLATLANTASIAASFSGKHKLAKALSEAANVGYGVKSAGNLSQGLHKKNKLQTISGALGLASSSGAASRLGRTARKGAVAYGNSRINKRRDSLWAIGFSPDPRSDAFIGSNLYNKGKEAAFKARHHRPAKG